MIVELLFKNKIMILILIYFIFLIFPIILYGIVSTTVSNFYLTLAILKIKHNCNLTYKELSWNKYIITMDNGVKYLYTNSTFLTKSKLQLID